MRCVVRAGGFSGNARVGARWPRPHPDGSGECAQVSRDAPPPLPGGYTVGEKVFYAGGSRTFENGTGNGVKLVHGEQGEVIGPATGKSTKGLKVLFPGNKDGVNCYLTAVRRLPAASAATLCLRPPAASAATLCPCPKHTTLPTPRAAALPRLACAPAPQPQLQVGSCQEPTLLASALVNVRR